MSLLPNLPTELMLNPSGTYSFVGHVPATLAYVTKDGDTPTRAQFDNARIAGPRVAGLRARVFATQALAMAALDEVTK